MNQLIIIAAVLVSANGLALWSPDYGYFHGYNWANQASWPFGWNTPLAAAPALTVIPPESGSIEGTAEVSAEEDSEYAAPEEAAEAEADEAAHKVIVPPFNPWGAYGSNLFGLDAYGLGGYGLGLGLGGYGAGAYGAGAYGAGAYGAGAYGAYGYGGYGLSAYGLGGYGAGYGNWAGAGLPYYKKKAQ